VGQTQEREREREREKDLVCRREAMIYERAGFSIDRYHLSLMVYDIFRERSEFSR